MDEYDNSADSSEPTPPDKDTVSDATLEEAQHILIDYIGLLTDTGSGAVARHVPGRAGRDLSRE